MMKIIIGVAVLLLFTVSALEKKTYYLTLEEIATQHGYLYEEHFVTTEDGYIIRIQRLRQPGNQPKVPMYASRPFAEGEISYFINEPVPIGIQLIENGHDLWSVGMRGSEGSQRHVSLSIEDTEYWDFDLADQALDHVAAIPYIIEYYNSWDEDTLDGGESWEGKPNYGTQKIHAMGYSQGGSSLANAIALYPDVMNPRIGLVHYISLAVTLAHSTAFIRLITGITNNIDPFIDQTGLGVLMGFGKGSSSILALLWNLSPETCMRVNSMIFEAGWDLTLTPNTFIDNMMNGVGSKTPKLYEHWFQSGISTHCWSRLFDYGTEGNLEVYGQEIPPHIPYENHRMPVAMYSSKSDHISTPEDNLWFAEQLGDSLVSFLQYEGDCHMSFGNGFNVEIIDDLLEIDEQYPISVEGGEE